MIEQETTVIDFTKESAAHEIWVSHARFYFGRIGDFQMLRRRKIAIAFGNPLKAALNGPLLADQLGPEMTNYGIIRLSIFHSASRDVDKANFVAFPLTRNEKSYTNCLNDAHARFQTASVCIKNANHNQQ